MFELVPTGRLAWTFTITRDGVPAGRLELKRLRPTGALTLDDQVYEIRRDGLAGPFLLLQQERVIARAERQSLLAPRYRIVAEDRQLELSSRGFLMRMAEVLHGDVVLATIRRTSLFRRRVTIAADATAPLPLIFFCSTLLILFWRHQSRASR